jgi:hypothetical protein
MSTPYDADTAQRLADELSRLVRDAESPTKPVASLHSDEAPLPILRATSNLAERRRQMEDSFQLVVGRDIAMTSARDLQLCAAAWRLAKDAHFPRRMERIMNPAGEIIYAYAINDQWIEDPHISETAEFPVDPLEHYGLRPEEVSALSEANRQLRSEIEAPVAGAASPTCPSELSVEVALPTLRDVLSVYPDRYIWHSGGGCHALRIDTEHGYVLLTEVDHAQPPPDDARIVDAGIYAPNGDEVETLAGLPLGNLAQWIGSALGRLRNPKSVADYFAHRLGANALDETLHLLPLESLCGKNCIKAIDAAAELLAHVRTTFPEHDLFSSEAARAHARYRLEDSVLATARCVLRAYWIGGYWHD